MLTASYSSNKMNPESYLKIKAGHSMLCSTAWWRRPNLVEAQGWSCRSFREARGWLDLERHIKAGGVANKRARNSNQWETRDLAGRKFWRWGASRRAFRSSRHVESAFG